MLGSCSTSPCGFAIPASHSPQSCHEESRQNGPSSPLLSYQCLGVTTSFVAWGSQVYPTLAHPQLSTSAHKDKMGVVLRAPANKRVLTGGNLSQYCYLHAWPHYGISSSLMLALLPFLWTLGSADLWIVIMKFIPPNGIAQTRKKMNNKHNHYHSKSIS